MQYLTALRRLIQGIYIIPIVILAFLFGIVWYSYQTTEKPLLPKMQEIAEVSKINEPIQPIPLTIELNEKKVTLGKKLFHEPLLSRNNSASCASCHNLSTAGVDRLVFSPNIDGGVTDRNTPTVFNSGFNFAQNWDGSATTLAEVTEKVVYDPKVFGSNWPEVISKLVKSPEYIQAFQQIYPDRITAENIKDAIAAFEKSLYTPNSRFDKFLRGENNALTEEEKKGYQIFKDYGCVSCHQGVNVGGNLFQKFGAIDNYFTEYAKTSKADWGRFNVTRDEADRYVFKVPSLRNVALTAPYLHNGAAKSLPEAIDIMAGYQLGRKLSLEDNKLIIKFLQTLTGEYQGKPL